MKNVPNLNNPNITFKDIEDEVARLQKELLLDQFLEKYRITENTQIDMPVPVITINDEIISTEGNLTIISGASKSGKSAFASILLAGAISVDGVIDGLKYVNIQANADKKAVIHIDTEQARHTHHANFMSILRRANIEDDCDYFLSYNIRQLERAKYMQVTSDICEGALERYKGIHLIVIDGIADFINDVNDVEQSTAIVKYFEKLAIKYRTPIVVVMHTNPGTNKERGHLGSHCQRKCESLLTIKNDGDISFIEPKLLRMAGKDDIPNIQFMYDKNKGYHVGCDVGSLIAEEKIERLYDLCHEVFAEEKFYNYHDAIEEIMIHTGKSINIAKAFFKEMKMHELITQGEDKCWRAYNN
jgi:hypothetical protein